MQEKQKVETITKSKISKQLKEKLGLSELVCQEMVENIFNEIVEITINKGRTTLQNFGTWKINNKKARPGINIKTSQNVCIQPRKVLRLVPAIDLKKLINHTDAD